jgi:apolipoprotein N-acyltransferase
VNYLLAVIFGLVSSTAFEPFSFWPSAFVGLAGWYFLLIRARLGSRVLISYVFGLSQLLVVQHWTGIYVGSLPWLVLSFCQAIFFILPAYFVGKSKRYNQFAFATSFVIIELLLRTIPFTGFGWTRISFTQVESPLSNLYKLGGVVLVAFFIAAISASRTMITGSILLILVALSAFIPNSVSSGPNVKIALIQGGVSNLGLDFNAKPMEVFNRHLSQTAKSIKPGDVKLIIWPENAVDVDINTSPTVASKITQISTDLRTPILIGGVTKSTAGLRNQSILLNPTAQQIYTKRYLTPFGEYMPLRNIATKFSSYANDVTDFVGGTDDHIFRVNGLTFQTLICYELLNDSFRDQISGDFLTVQTNNATFGDTSQLEQELNIAKVRAIETGRFIPYVSTTGVTSFIDNNGQIYSELPKFNSATLIDNVSSVQGRTWTQIYGRYLESISIVWLLIILFFRRKVSK